MEFFIAMVPPTATGQMRKVTVTAGGKPRFYDPPAVSAARSKLNCRLAQYRPHRPLEGSVRLVVKWMWPCGSTHHNGEYKTTRPDTDNLQKLLKDEMTKLGYWKDDAQVASEICEKFWAAQPGLYVKVVEL